MRPPCPSFCGNRGEHTLDVPGVAPYESEVCDDSPQEFKAHFRCARCGRTFTMLDLTAARVYRRVAQSAQRERIFQALAGAHA